MRRHAAMVVAAVVAIDALDARSRLTAVRPTSSSAPSASLKASPSRWL